MAGLTKQKLNLSLRDGLFTVEVLEYGVYENGVLWIREDNDKRAYFAPGEWLSIGYVESARRLQLDLNEHREGEVHFKNDKVALSVIKRANMNEDIVENVMTRLDLIEKGEVNVTVPTSSRRYIARTFRQMIQEIKEKYA